VAGEGDGARPGQRLSELLFAAALAVFFFAAFPLVPAMGALGLPFAAVPVVRLTHRRGLGAGLLASGLSAVAVSGLAAAVGSDGLSLAAIAAGVTALPAAFAAFGRSGREPSRGFLGLCLAGLLALLVFTGLRSLSGDRSIQAEIEGTFDRMVPAALESYSRSSKDPETVENVRRTLSAAREIARRFWPGILGASWVLGAAISFYAGARAARPAPSAEQARFEKLRVPAAAAGLFVLSGAASALLTGPAREAAGNVLLPLAALYFVAGLSIICHFARKWLRVRILRVGLYALVVYFPMNVAVTLLGLFDWYADFRRRGQGAMEKS